MPRAPRPLSWRQVMTSLEAIHQALELALTVKRVPRPAWEYIEKARAEVEALLRQNGRR